MKKLLFIVGAVLLFLWWRGRSTSTAAATPLPIGGTSVPQLPNNANTVAPSKPVSAYEQWMRHMFPERFRDIMQATPAKLWEMLGVDQGAEGSNIPWGFWDPYLGAPGGTNPATGTMFNPFGALGAPNGNSSGGASGNGWSISMFPETSFRPLRPNDSSNG